MAATLALDQTWQENNVGKLSMCWGNCPGQQKSGTQTWSAPRSSVSTNTQAEHYPGISPSSILYAQRQEMIVHHMLPSYTFIKLVSNLGQRTCTQTEAQR
eukprot:1142362-Pelagomonas_calceolata.AAC.9